MRFDPVSQEYYVSTEFPDGSNYPPGVSDNDFDDGEWVSPKPQEYPPPTTTMVYCPPCMRHWEAPAREDWWNARTELCESCKREQNR